MADVGRHHAGDVLAMIEMSAEARSLRDLGRALKGEADGKKLRRDLSKELRDAMGPAVSSLRGNIAGMSSQGRRVGAPLRSSIARQIKAEARLSGRSTGVRVKATKKRMPRGFENAPKRTNSDKGWRRMVFGDQDVWVEQVGKPGWFDDEMPQHAGEARAACERAMRKAIARIDKGV